MSLQRPWAHTWSPLWYAMVKRPLKSDRTSISDILDDVCEQWPEKSPCQVSNFGAKCRIATPSSRCLLWTMVKNTALSSVSQILTRLGSLTKWLGHHTVWDKQQIREKDKATRSSSTSMSSQCDRWPPSSCERGGNKRTHFRSIEAPPYELRPKSYENYTC